MSLTQLQPGLFDAPPPTVSLGRRETPKRKLTAAERFEEFHRANPQVYAAICDYARMVKARGHKFYSVKTIWCVLRFQMDTKSTESHKFNDLFTSHYARLVMKQEADLANFFELRERRK